MVQFILELLKVFAPDIGSKIGLKWGNHLKSKYPNIVHNKWLKGLAYLMIAAIAAGIIIEILWSILDGSYWLACILLLVIASGLFRAWWETRRKKKNEIRHCPICTCTLMHGETICRFCDTAKEPGAGTPLTYKLPITGERDGERDVH